MTYFYSDQDGKVKMRSETQQDAPSLIEHFYEPTAEELDLINLNAEQKIINGQLFLKDPKPLPTDTTEEREALKEELRTKAQKAKSIADLQDIIQQLLV